MPRLMNSAHVVAELVDDYDHGQICQKKKSPYPPTEPGNKLRHRKLTVYYKYCYAAFLFPWQKTLLLHCTFSFEGSEIDISFVSKLKNKEEILYGNTFVFRIQQQAIGSPFAIRSFQILSAINVW
ncbi:hypothetical protein VNO77_40278 [Canavalia gladiata]|uniref:Uncharacterized protein n=1 Tax=Canavalia gladiata TaxID=3824 RepID=A0AAN9PPI5_CANGL